MNSLLFKYYILCIILDIDRILVKCWNIFRLIYSSLASNLACLPYYEYEFIINHIMALEILEQLSTAK